VKRTRFVVVGLGNVGMELLRRLSREFDVTCVDIHPDRVQAAAEARGEPIPVIVGDATSRLVLEEADVDGADAVLITTTTERINAEVCRVLRDHFQPRRVVSLGITPGGIKQMRGLDVEVEDIFHLSATALRNRIEKRSKAAHGIGLEKDEILEVEVHPHSRLAGKPLRTLSPQRWNIGIVYRDGRILVPHGDTVLRGGDRAILLGDPHVVKTVAEILTFNFKRFPLEYGASLTALLLGTEDLRFFEELAYLRSVLPLERTLLLATRGAAPRRERLEALASEANLGPYDMKELRADAFSDLRRLFTRGEESRGLVVVSRPGVSRTSVSLSTDSRRQRFLQALATSSGSPVLLAGGTFPYGRLAMPCVEGVDVEHVLETVFEAAEAFAAEPTALLAEPSPHLSSNEDDERFALAKRTVSDMGIVYKTSIATESLKGNPVLAVGRALESFQLLVLDTGGWRRAGWLSRLLDPDVAWQITRRAAVSTLLVPPVEESL